MVLTGFRRNENVKVNFLMFKVNEEASRDQRLNNSGNIKKLYDLLIT